MKNLNDEKETIRILKNDLYEVRLGLLHMMPKEIIDILDDGCSFNSKIKMMEWQNQAIEKIIVLAEQLTPLQSSPSSDRVYCPLCGKGSSSPGTIGFSLPIGLKRHLEGFGNSRQCVVMKSATRIYEHSEIEIL